MNASDSESLLDLATVLHRFVLTAAWQGSVSLSILVIDLGSYMRSHWLWSTAPLKSVLFTPYNIASYCYLRSSANYFMPDPQPLVQRFKGKVIAWHNIASEQGRVSLELYINASVWPSTKLRLRVPHILCFRSATLTAQWLVLEGFPAASSHRFTIGWIQFMHRLKIWRNSVHPISVCINSLIYFWDYDWFCTRRN